MEYRTMTLRECAKFDKENKAREKVTGWGRISADRNKRKVSRKWKIRNKQG